MSSLWDEIARVRNAVGKLDTAIALPAVNTFSDTLAPPLRQIAELLHTVDLLHLSSVPIKTLTAIADRIDHPLECIENFIVPSVRVGESVDTRAGVAVVPPAVHVREPGRISSWRGQLENVHRDLFQLIGPVVGQQQLRLEALTSAVPIKVDRSQSITTPTREQNVYRYMPLRNLLRCEAACGIWLVSLERLRTWSSATMADIREGEVPPVVERLKGDYEAAKAQGGNAIEEFKRRNSFDDDDVRRLTLSLNFSFERQNTFVSSWSQNENESSTMWSAYGDGGKGIALRSNTEKLLAGEWRVPLALSGLNGPNKITGLMLREVRYLNFNDHDDVPSINDMHLPLLKRSPFRDEREIRLIAFTRNPIASQGFPLHCNLQHIITEIIVGPHSPYEEIVRQLSEKAADLQGIPIVRSTLSPSAER